MSNSLGWERAWQVQRMERRPDGSRQGKNQEKGMDGGREIRDGYVWWWLRRDGDAGCRNGNQVEGGRNEGRWGRDNRRANWGQKRGTDEWTDRSQGLRLGIDSCKEWASV